LAESKIPGFDVYYQCIDLFSDGGGH